MAEPILEVVSLEKRYPVYGTLGRMGKPQNYIYAAADVSFQLQKGQTYGLVGESGSGKTTVGRTILNLQQADGGKVIYKGVNLTTLKEKEFRPYRKELQIVFQDPYSSLNPQKRVGAILEEPLVIHGIGNKAQRQKKAFEILETVGLLPEHYFRYPHEFSGGQRQRLGLARALIMDPEIIICDEPVSALDVSIQAQILNFLGELQKKRNLTLLFITHDISVVRHISDRIGVMYLGSIVEEADTDELFQNPVHPYTQLLLSSVPRFSEVEQEVDEPLQAEAGTAGQAAPGCKFYPRCSRRSDKCLAAAPVRDEVAPGHYVSCHLVRDSLLLH